MYEYFWGVKTSPVGCLNQNKPALYMDFFCTSSKVDTFTVLQKHCVKMNCIIVYLLAPFSPFNEQFWL